MKIVRLLVFLLASGALISCRAAETAELPLSPTVFPTPEEAATAAPADLPNPASVNCEEQGYSLEMRQSEDGTYGVCLFPDGSECEEWAYFRGECQPGDSLIEPTKPPPVTATAVPRPERWQLYTNEAPPYTFLYPPQAVIEQGNDPRQAVTIAGPLVEDEHWPMFFIGHAQDQAEFRLPKDADLRQWLIAQGLLGAESETPPVEDQQVQRRIGGEPAVHTRFDRGQQSYASDQYFFAHEGQLYSIVILHTGDREDWDLYNQFLDGFQFLPGVTPEESFQPPAACPQVTPGIHLLFDGEKGICFLYPDDFDVFQGTDGSLTIYRRLLLNTEAPVATIHVEAADGRSLAEVSEQRLADFAFPETQAQDTQLAGQPASLLDQLPGQDLNRRLVALYQDQVYDLMVARIGDEYGTVGEEAAALFDLLTGSWQFVDRDTQVGLWTGPECPAEEPGTVLLRNDDHGVSFQFDPALATSVQPQLVDAFTDDNGMDYLLRPPHLAFIFAGSYADDEPLLQRQQLNLAAMPQIVVYPASDYAAMHSLAGAQIEQLQALLAARVPTPGGSLPYLPLHNAAQIFHSQLAYPTFSNGAGTRFVTAFSQESSPITNQQLIYTFQGLTDDGRYYVAAFFPVKTAFLPDTVQIEDWEAFNANYSTYVRETQAALNDLTPKDFLPDLTVLDAVVASLQVEPDVALGGAETAVPLEEPGLTGPIGVYQVYDNESGLYRLYREETAGRYQQVAENRYPLLPAPDAAHAVYLDEDQRLWLVDLAGGSERLLAEDIGSYLWGDAHTLLLGVHLSTMENEGPSPGHLAMLAIDSGDLKIIDEEYVSLGRPAMAPDGQSIAYDISPYATTGINSRIYRPDSGSQPLDPTLFAGLEGEPACTFLNPAWSPDGRQLAWLCGREAGSSLVVFDLARQTAMAIFTWQPAQFGALPPSPVWSADGKWLAIEIWANNQDESGLWVLPADGTLARLHVPTGHDPIWLNPSQLIYADLDENMNGDIKLFDFDSGETRVMDFPAGSQVLLTPPYVFP